MQLAAVTVIGLVLFYGALFVNGQFDLSFGSAHTNWLVWLHLRAGLLVLRFGAADLELCPADQLPVVLHQSSIGMAVAVLGIFVKHPVLQRPMFTAFHRGQPALWPDLVCDHCLRRDFGLAWRCLVDRHVPAVAESETRRATGVRRARCSWR